jgi:hypothetical protein
MPDEETPFPAAKAKDHAPWWPFSAWWTLKLIRDGKLTAISSGRRRLLSVKLLRQYLDENTGRAA